MPGAFEMLSALRQLGLPMYLASGTDEQYVVEEAALLGLVPYFGDHVYGALDDYKSFSKKMVIERILRENQVDGRRPSRASATATWRSRTSRRSAASRSRWPATRPAAAASPTPGNGTG